MLALVLPLGLLALWQLSTSLGWFTATQLPAPGTVLQAGINLFDRGLLVKFVGISTQRVLVGFLVGASLGLVLGAITGLTRTWAVFFGPTLGAVRAVPSLAWVPLLLLWLKIGEESKITLIAIGAFFPVYTTVSAALRHVDAQLVEAGRAFGLTGCGCSRPSSCPPCCPRSCRACDSPSPSRGCSWSRPSSSPHPQVLASCSSTRRANGRVDRILLAILMLGAIGLTQRHHPGPVRAVGHPSLDLTPIVRAGFIVPCVTDDRDRYRCRWAQVLGASPGATRSGLGGRRRDTRRCRAPDLRRACPGDGRGRAVHRHPDGSRHAVGHPTRPVGRAQPGQDVRPAGHRPSAAQRRPADVDRRPGQCPRGLGRAAARAAPDR